MDKLKGKAVVGTPWWLRLAIYAVIAVAGLIMTVLGFATPEMVDSWLSQAGWLAATIGGLLAVANTDKASDSKIIEVPVTHDVPRDVVEDALKSLPSVQVEVRKLEDARHEAERVLSDVTDKVNRVQKGEPIFSVFH